MRFRNYRQLVSIAIAYALLAGCGGSQPPIAMPQSRAIAMHADHSGSWMLPEAKGEDLLFVTKYYGLNYGYVFIYTLNTGNQVGQVSQKSPEGACANREGDVFVPGGTGQPQIVVYRHNGTVKRTLTAYPVPFSCSVDPTTGNLAVTSRGDPGALSIYLHAQGTPILYHSAGFFGPVFCGYDDSGNLFIDGQSQSYAFALGELPKGGTSINTVTLNSRIKYAGQVQWDGKYLAIADASTNAIFRFRISGSYGFIQGTTYIANWTVGDFWIQGLLLVVSASRVFNGYAYTEVQYYRYPAGGHPIRRFPRSAYTAFGVAVSLARQ